MQAAVRRSVPLLRIPLPPSHHSVLFHSTPVSLAKSRIRSGPKISFVDGESDRGPSKSHIRFAVRQKRADSKRALKDYLLFGKTSKLHSQDENRSSRSEKSTRRNSGKANSRCSSSSGKGKRGGNKGWKNKPSFYDDDNFEPRQRIFEAAFGAHEGFTWGFSSWGNYAENPIPGFEWKEEPKEKTQRKIWNESDAEDDTADMIPDTYRQTLGLPLAGPLKLDDVKCAFRASALKWHPDKHQGPSQGIAEEKFKLCVEAYGALCNALKSA